MDASANVYFSTIEFTNLFISTDKSAAVRPGAHFLPL
jgi:hypothetical protein